MTNYERHLAEPFQIELDAAIAERNSATSPKERSRCNSRIRSIRLAAARAKATHSEDEWQLLLQQLAYRCAMCGVFGNGVRLQKDHVVPIYQGGSDGIDNLQPLCQPCNTAKGPDTTNWAAYRLQAGFEQ
jgi:5-methylcytosine-specific restriction endonuclease McrA